MSDNVEHIIIEQFRRLNARLDRFEFALDDIKTRLTVVEETAATTSSRLAILEVSIGGMIKRMDRIETRLDRIEKRLDLVEVH